MYRFQGVKVTRKRFWELAKLANDLEILEKELDKEVGRNIEKDLIFELVEELEKKEQEELQKDEIAHSFCSSKRSFRNTLFRKSEKDSDFEDYENAVMA